MIDSSPIAARAQARQHARMQEGTVVSYTTLTHPPAEFGPFPRQIALIELRDGSRVLAPLLSDAPAIGMHVRPRMRLSAVNGQSLRLYDVAYEETVRVRVPEATFPGFILALTGPSGVGKSTVSRLLIRMVADYAESVPMTTTAPRSQREHGEERHVSKEKFQSAIESGDMVAMTQRIDESGDKHWYGYRAADMETIRAKGKLPVVTTDMLLLRQLSEKFGRKAILSFGLLPPGKGKRAMLSHLLRRLRETGRGTEEWIAQRINGAAKDLQLLRTHAELFDRILVNDDADAVAEILRKQVPGSNQA